MERAGRELLGAGLGIPKQARKNDSGKKGTTTGKREEKDHLQRTSSAAGGFLEKDREGARGENEEQYGSGAGSAFLDKAKILFPVSLFRKRG